MEPPIPAIRTVRTVDELRGALLAARQAHSGKPACVADQAVAGQARDTDASQGRSEVRVGLVPTMGALHEGHRSLLERAREECDIVVVSLFVNPAQFNEQVDLESYPRQELRDLELAGKAGAELLFAPAPDEIYPAGFATAVEVLGLTERLEGAARGAAHFRGVTTVVSKLLNIVQPEIAYFGQKDAQQVAVLKRLVSDLNIPVQIRVCATVREPDGLACSSRNALLDSGERIQARALYAGLSAALGLVCDGEISAHTLLRAARAAMLPLEVEPEYLALVDPATLEPMGSLDRDGLLVVAAAVGSTRLIDNLVLHPCARTAWPGAVSDDATQSTNDATQLESSAHPNPPVKAMVR